MLSSKLKHLQPKQKNRMSDNCGIELSHDLFAKKWKRHLFSHAKSLDRYLGYRVPKIEAKLLQKYRAYDRSNDNTSKKKHYMGTQTWIGLHPQALQTPYFDIYEVLSFLKNEDVKHVVDIGAGYGRVGIVANVIYPEVKFTGYEILRQRQQEGNRIYSNLNLDNCKIELEDVLEPDFELPKAEVYFIYDFSEKEHVYRILKSLSERINRYKFYLIARGDRVDYVIENNFRHVWDCCFDLGSSGLKVYSPSI